MSTLIDTNILIRLIDLTARAHLAAQRATAKLRAESEKLFIVPQNLYEY